MHRWYTVLEFLHQLGDHHGIERVMVARIAVQTENGTEQRLWGCGQQTFEVLREKVEQGGVRMQGCAFHGTKHASMSRPYRMNSDEAGMKVDECGDTTLPPATV